MSEGTADDSTAFRRRLSQIRHDLRNPVGHVIGYSEMLAEELDSDSDAEILQDLGRIRTSGERLVELIEDLLGPAKQSVEEIDVPFTQHQLRIQLNHINGYCDIVREVAEDEERADLLPDIEKIGTAANTFLKTMDERLQSSALDVSDDPAEPAADTAALAEAGETDAAPAEAYQVAWLGDGGEILVVDDDPANRELLQRRLERQGYQVVVASDGQSALDRLRTDPVDLILLDMLMPGLSGTDVLKRLKEDKALRNIPVIILSALDDMDQIVECVLLGAEDYVLKPFNPVLLRARIAASLEKHRLRVQQALRLSVFISSPGDVAPERRLVRQIINGLNEELTGKVYLMPIFWEEEPLLASETFQSQIHPPRETDIYLGIFWSRLGSKLPEHIRRPDGTRYASGSEFEFEDAMEGFENTGRPEILIYRKIIEPVVTLTNRDEMLERIDQKENLDTFVRRWFQSEDGKSFTAAFHIFESDEQFEDLVTHHLRKLATKRLEQDA
jgi:DNA-binding response OmpR family regulator